MNHDVSRIVTKPTKWHVRPAKTQISMGIRPVWSEYSLCASWVAKCCSFLQADSEDRSDWADAQADLSLRWAHMPFCWFCHEAAHVNALCFIYRGRFINKAKYCMSPENYPVCNWGPYDRLALGPNMVSSWIKFITIIISCYLHVLFVCRYMKPLNNKNWEGIEVAKYWENINSTKS